MKHFAVAYHDRRRGNIQVPREEGLGGHQPGQRTGRHHSTA